MNDVKQQDVKQEDRIKTVIMLYDGAINFVKIAKKKAEQGDTPGKEQYIDKVSAIVTELSNSLKMDGDEISNNLNNLYEFIFNCLQRARTDNDINAYDDAMKVLNILGSAWKEMLHVNQNF